MTTLTRCRQNFENEISRLEVVAILVKVVNVGSQAPLMSKKQMYDKGNLLIEQSQIL